MKGMENRERMEREKESLRDFTLNIQRQSFEGEKKRKQAYI
jgi:hypothetical protein